MSTEFIVIAVLAVIAIFTVIRFLRHPGRFIIKLVINAVLGLAGLILVNYLGSSFDFSIVINPWTVLISGIFGLPGVIFLIVLSLI